MTMTNPKRFFNNASGKSVWFDYYAGFSAAFVSDVLTKMRVSGARLHILDPWNGAGTTTTVASEMNFDSTGFDINPVMVIVAKSKLLHGGVRQSLSPLAEELIAKALTAMDMACRDDDPLLNWFAPRSAQFIRALTAAVADILVPQAAAGCLYSEASLSYISDLAAFFIVALFRTVRSHLSKYQATNPTWIKLPEHSGNRVRPTAMLLHREFRSHVEAMASALIPTAPETAQAARPLVTLDLADSSNLPLPDASVDAVVSSPPYCTRIDYAIATRPELAVLGCTNATQFTQLRKRMIGSPAVGVSTPNISKTWGNACLSFLEKARHHPSKASDSYYRKLLLQYYGGMSASLAQLDRVLRPGGQCVLVAQDSYYKEIHNDLPCFLTEMAECQGWKIFSRHDFRTQQLMSRMNPRSRRYRRHGEGTEAVLWFQKSA